MKAIKWFAGFFEDQGQSASSKRGTLYIFCFFFYLLIDASTHEKPVDTGVLAGVLIVILFCLGAITSEFFKDFKIQDITQKTTEIKTEIKTP